MASAASRGSRLTPDFGASLRDLLKDPLRLRQTIEAGKQRAERGISGIAAQVTPKVGIGLLQGLAFAEIARGMKMAKATTPSDLCGQARFLRGLIVGRELDPDGMAAAEPELTPAWNAVTVSVQELWHTLFWLERLEGELTKQGHTLNEQQVDGASIAASYGRTDIDIGYVEQVEDRCRAVFTPLEEAFVRPTFRLPVEKLLAGFPSILSGLKDRIHDIPARIRGLSLPRASKKEAQLSAFRAALQITTADLPESWAPNERESFLEAFSFTAGAENPDYKLPSDDNVTLRKPLLRLSGQRYLLIDPVFCRYAPSRLLCHAVEASQFRARYLRLRDLALEKRVGELFAAAAEPAIHFHGVYLPVGDNGDLAEQDHIFVADGRLFVLECKAKRVRSPLTHGGNVSKVRDDLRNSVSAAFVQGDRARRHILALDGLVPLFDQHGKQIGQLDRQAINSAHVVVVTWESLGPLSTDLKPWLSVPPGTEYPWVVWVDDLQTALTKLRPATEIAKYVSWRSGLNGRLFAGDEMHVVGCFLANHTNLPTDATIMLDGTYAEIFDDDYLGRQPSAPDPQPHMIQLAHEHGRPTVRLNGELLASGPFMAPRESRQSRRSRERPRRR